MERRGIPARGSGVGTARLPHLHDPAPGRLGDHPLRQGVERHQAPGDALQLCELLRSRDRPAVREGDVRRPRVAGQLRPSPAEGFRTVLLPRAAGWCELGSDVRLRGRPPAGSDRAAHAAPRPRGRRLPGERLAPAGSARVKEGQGRPPGVGREQPPGDDRVEARRLLGADEPSQQRQFHLAPVHRDRGGLEPLGLHQQAQPHHGGGADR